MENIPSEYSHMVAPSFLLGLQLLSFFVYQKKYYKKYFFMLISTICVLLLLSLRSVSPLFSYNSDNTWSMRQLIIMDSIILILTVVSVGLGIYSRFRIKKDKN